MFINILVTTALMLFTAGVAMAQYYPERRLVREGNEQFERLNYRNALNRYNEALEHDTTKYESLYNRANAYLQNMLANPADTTPIKPMNYTAEENNFVATNKVCATH